MLLPSGGLALLMPGLETLRAVPGPQLLWLAQDLLLWLAWHALPWLARLAMQPELEAQVQQGWFADGRRTDRSLSRSWLETRQQAVSGSRLFRSHNRVLPTVMGRACGRALRLFDVVVVLHDVRCRNISVLQCFGVAPPRGEVFCKLFGRRIGTGG